MHGYPDRLLRYQPPFAAIAPSVSELIGESDLIVAHNAEFDMSFTEVEMQAVGLPLIGKPVFCTMRRYGAFYSGSHSLDAVAARIGLKRAGRRHGALEDAWLAMMIYLWLRGCPARLPFEALPKPLPSNLRRMPLLPFGLLFPRKSISALRAARRIP